jgi:hypothetical protein
VVRGECDYGGSSVFGHELCQGDPERLCQPLDVEERDVSLPALDTADVSPVEGSHFGKFLLRNADPFADLAQPLTKPYQHVRQGCCHSPRR